MQVVWDLEAWFPLHNPYIRSRLDEVVKAMKEQGITKLGAVGYCLGGALIFYSSESRRWINGVAHSVAVYTARYVFDCAFDKVVDVAVVTHPSQLQIQDLEVCFTRLPLHIIHCSHSVR